MCLPGIKHNLQLDQKTTMIPLAALESLPGYFIYCPALTGTYKSDPVSRRDVSHEGVARVTYFFSALQDIFVIHESEDGSASSTMKKIAIVFM